MGKTEANTPRLTERAKAAKEKKSAALKSALRSNLHKRKAQARAKASQNDKE